MSDTCARCGLRHPDTQVDTDGLCMRLVGEHMEMRATTHRQFAVLASGWMQEAWCLWRQLDALQAENARLREIADRLPKLADGEVAWPGSIVWAAFRDGVFRGAIRGPSYSPKRVAVHFDERIALTDDIRVRDTEPLLSCLYSTRAAAEAAKEQP